MIQPHLQTPIENTVHLSLEPISYSTEVALSVFAAGRNTDMVSLVIRAKSNLHVTTTTGLGYLNEGV